MSAPSWLPASDLLGYLKVAAGSENESTVELCRVAACRVVERVRRDLKLSTVTDPTQVGEDVRHGTILLAARLYARKGSPQGIATFGELGASTILRTDPDIGLLLGIGRYGKPAVG